MQLTDWLQIAAICLTGAASPGPSLAVVVRNTLAGGRRQGMATGLGHGLGVGIYAFGAVAGVSAVVAGSPELHRAITVAGALYLAWLGVQALRHAGEGAGGDGGSGGGFREGFGVAFLNPKIAVFFLALLGSFGRVAQVLHFDLARLLFDSLSFIGSSSVGGRPAGAPPERRPLTD